MTQYETQTQKSDPIASLQDCTRFQLEILYELYGDACYGLALKDRLAAVYGEDINHGRLYPVLDDLADADLVDKSEHDGRTNRYALTSHGRAAVELDADQRDARLEGEYHDE